MSRLSLRHVVFGTAAILAILLFVFEGEILLALFAGALLGVLFWEVASLVSQRTPIGYKTAVALLFLLSLAATGLGTWLMGGRVLEQLRELASRLPQQLQAASAYLKHSPLVRNLLPGDPASTHGPTPEQLVSGTATVVSGMVEVLGGLVVVAFVGAYIALDPKAYVKPLAALAGKENAGQVEEVAARVAHTLGRWLLGRMIAMLFVGVVTGIGLALLKIPLALSLGVIAGLLAFVEYVGAVASALPAIALALSSSLTSAIWVSLLYLGVHIVEGYGLTPLLAKKAVHLPPAYTLAGQAIFGVLLGALGLTLSTPLLVVAVVVVQALYVEPRARATATKV